MVGFDNKTYLDNLLISDTEQFEFYQGMIQQNCPGVFNSLLRSDFIDSFVDMGVSRRMGIEINRLRKHQQKIHMFRFIS